VEPYDPSLTIYRKKFSNYLPWHAHITCLTVAPGARRLGLATKLSEALEVAGDEADGWFVDLFVRVENVAAIKLYKKMGCVADFLAQCRYGALLTTNFRYSVYRRIVDYYADGADAFDMRKPLRRDKQRKTVRPNGENIKVDPSEVW
jgi:N-terminal acetyltransferase B complex catalytic subunit